MELFNFKTDSFNCLKTCKLFKAKHKLLLGNILNFMLQLLSIQILI